MVISSDNAVNPGFDRAEVAGPRGRTAGQVRVAREAEFSEVGRKKHVAVNSGERDRFAKRGDLQNPTAGQRHRVRAASGVFRAMRTHWRYEQYPIGAVPAHEPLAQAVRQSGTALSDGEGRLSYKCFEDRDV